MISFSCTFQHKYNIYMNAIMSVGSFQNILKVFFPCVSDKPIQLILCILCYSFFAVHPVSMNSSNRLISGDNKGYASYKMEMEMNPGTFHGQVMNIKMSLVCILMFLCCKVESDINVCMCCKTCYYTCLLKIQQK